LGNTSAKRGNKKKRPIMNNINPLKYSLFEILINEITINIIGHEIITHLRAESIHPKLNDRKMTPNKMSKIPIVAPCFLGELLEHLFCVDRVELREGEFEFVSITFYNLIFTNINTREIILLVKIDKHKSFTRRMSKFSL
jgi:hypothetical protein